MKSKLDRGSSERHIECLKGPASGGGGGYSGRNVKLNIHLCLVPRSRMMELYLHSPTRFTGAMIN
jgi:hypothetical protein